MKGLDFFKMASNITHDDDIEYVSDAAFRTFVELIAISSEELTDGRVSIEHARRLCKTPDFDVAISELISKNFVKNGGDKLVVRSYKKHQMTRREVLDKREKQRERVTRYRRVSNALVTEQSKSKSKSKDARAERPVENRPAHARFTPSTDEEIARLEALEDGTKNKGGEG